MLVLSRKPDESIIIDGGICITVVAVQGNRVRLGIEAPRDVSIVRKEILDLTISEPADTAAARR